MGDDAPGDSVRPNPTTLARMRSVQQENKKETSVQTFGTDVIDQCDALTSSEAVDKTTALNIMRLYHDLRDMHHTTIVEKDRQIDQLETELKISRMTHIQGEKIEANSSAVEALQSKLNRLSEQLNSMGERLSELQQRVALLPAKKR